MTDCSCNNFWLLLEPFTYQTTIWHTYVKDTTNFRTNTGASVVPEETLYLQVFSHKCTDRSALIDDLLSLAEDTIDFHL